MEKGDCRIWNFVTNWLWARKREVRAPRFDQTEEYWYHSPDLDLDLSLGGNIGVQRNFVVVSINGTNFTKVDLPGVHFFHRNNFYIFLWKLKKMICLKLFSTFATLVSSSVFHACFSLCLCSDWRPFVSVASAFVFRRYEFHPVCADLQAQILQCYRQNTQQTLGCSALASQYMRCVNQAKQVGVRTRLLGCQKIGSPVPG